MTDHRIGLTLRNLQGVLDGDLDRVVEPLILADREEKTEAKQYRRRKNKAMKTQVLPITPESVALAARLLQQGELVALPTETVYGIAADARNGEAVKKNFLKRRAARRITRSLCISAAWRC